MKQIKILDTTLRDGEQSPGCSMQKSEKLAIAKQLEKLGVDIIEAGFAVSSPGDFESIKAVSEVIKDSIVCSLSRAVKADISSSYDAIKNAVSPRIHVFLATSPVHMKYKLKMDENDVLQKIKESVSFAKSLLSDVEFSAEDAFRSDKEFLCKAIDAAIKAGAVTVNLPDTVGYSTPWEITELFKHVVNTVPNIDKAVLSTHNHNDLGLAVSNSLAAVYGGASQIECTVCGIGERAGNAALEEIVMALNTRKEFFNVSTKIKTEEIYNTSKLLHNIIGRQISPNKAIVGANAFAHESGIHQHGILANKSTYEIMSPQSIGIPENKFVLGKHSGKHAFKEYLIALGKQCDEKMLNDYFEKFKALADKKKTVSGKDIEALVSTGALNFESGYKLESFDITTSSNGKNTALITLSIGEKIKTSECNGTGPIDAAFNAVNKISGKNFILEDFSLHAITEGEDAQGEAVVRIRLEKEVIIARGISLDIIEASILAYINGVNKLLFK